MDLDELCRDEGRRQRFSSDILPRYMRKTPKVAEVLPVLYLRGLSSGDFVDGLSCLLGKDASGLSASSFTRLTVAWDKEYQQFRNRSFKEKDIVSIWADGVHFNVGLEDDRLRQRVTKGAGTRALTRPFKLLDMAQQRWRRVTASELLHSVRAGVVFQDGIMKEASSKNGRKKAG